MYEKLNIIRLKSKFRLSSKTAITSATLVAADCRSRDTVCSSLLNGSVSYASIKQAGVGVLNIICKHLQLSRKTSKVYVVLEMFMQYSKLFLRNNLSGK